MSINYTSINPTLLSPAQLVTQRMQLQAKEQAIPVSPSRCSNSDDPEFPPHVPPTTSSIFSQQRLPEFVNSLKRKFDLQPQDCTELDELVVIAVLLDIHREQKKLATSNGDSLSSTLKATARHYSIAILLSPHISSYAGKSFADIVVKCMRASGVEGVPTDHQVTELKALKTLIGEYATQDRFSLKNKVANSLAEDSPHKNFAQLAQAIIGTHGFQITADFLGCLAALRWAVGEYKNKSPCNFWPLFDASIDTWRGDGGYKAWGNSVTITIKYMYDEDVDMHGDPANTEKVINDWAKKIVPLPSNDQNKPSETGRHKWARIDDGMQDSEHEDGLIGNGSEDAGGDDPSVGGNDTGTITV
ncbi:hypothetical protein EV359DRAFT_86342 [Lentinula novae-zelandiae]|nr:hypothetical protein EV359DRAFT_86342 [Lentinula novae-zelandiae]